MQDQVIPGEKWEFDKEVTQVFEDMLTRSIPQYDVMRRACYDIGRKFIKKGTDIVDIGCSRGEALSMFIDEFGIQNHYIGLEISDPMIEAANKRYETLINCGAVSIKKHDLRLGYIRAKSSLTLCVLTLQFTPIEYRQRILRDIYKTIEPGGALILVEKVLGSCAEIDAIMVDLYYKLKSDNGYSQEQIQRKRMSLEGVLVPVTAQWNEELLRMAGFNRVECFWRWMNFAGWLAVKQD